MRRLLFLFSLLVSVFSVSAQGEDYISFNSYSVREITWIKIDSFFINGPVFPSDSVFFLIGTQENLGDIAVFGDTVIFLGGLHDNMEGVRLIDENQDYYSNGLIIGPLPVEPEMVEYVTILIKREGQVVKNVSFRNSIITGMMYKGPSEIKVDLFYSSSENVHIVKNISSETLNVSFYSLLGHIMIYDKSIQKGESLKIEGHGIVKILNTEESLIQIFRI